MKQSQLFTKTRKEVPADEVAKNAQLLVRAGYINKEMAGVYDYLPLGLRVLNKIIGIIREEMNAIGGQEIFMSSLQRKELWERSGRWSDEVVDNWFKTKLKDGGDVGLGFTHEEPISNMLEQFVSSYKDFGSSSFSVYQFQTKFRNELRAKSGIMRTREFIMKDLYSFSKSSAQHEIFYQQAKGAYEQIFKRVGIGNITYFTRASGGTFSKFSHEFQTISDAGEDTIYVKPDFKIAVNQEIINDPEAFDELGDKSEFVAKKAVEVGNIFTLGTKFSEHLTFANDKGEKEKVFMGSYGIGPARVMGTIVEVLADEKGLVWPKEVAPFAVHLISIEGRNGEKISMAAEKLYSDLTKAGVEVLYDDRDMSAGAKFGDSDLIGIPTRVVISEKTLEKDSVEVKDRVSGEVKMMPLSEIVGAVA
jgi:prolyl-tRNA synthetase